MLACYSEAKDVLAVPMIFIPMANLAQWLTEQSDAIKNWVASTGFTAKPDTVCLIPAENNTLATVLVGCNKLSDLWIAGALPTLLPVGNYYLGQSLPAKVQENICLSWGLGAYLFSRYKKPQKTIAKLLIPDEINHQQLIRHVEAIYLVRDLINIPTEHMGPSELASAAKKLADEFSAQCSFIVGDELLQHNYPAIHAVGRASAQAPRLIDIRWGNQSHPKVTLVGKGVCFDTGGLDIKGSNYMLLMKKDMGGAAHALGLARMIMAAGLPINLRVLIPAVENSISANAYRPGDVITTRKGLTVEIGNTDAEGRVILADALAEACMDNPGLIIDFATLTGAARTALGTDLPALFTDDEVLAQALADSAKTTQDPLWRLPLYAPYRQMLDSSIADINNSTASGYAGAITAALFLKEFIEPGITWAHFDLMAWNVGARPGRPEGGEAMTLRAVFNYLCKRYSK